MNVGHTSFYDQTFHLCWFIQLHRPGAGGRASAGTGMSIDAKHLSDTASHFTWPRAVPEIHLKKDVRPLLENPIMSLKRRRYTSASLPKSCNIFSRDAREYGQLFDGVSVSVIEALRSIFLNQFQGFCPNPIYITIDGSFDHCLKSCDVSEHAVCAFAKMPSNPCYSHYAR
jgi:hypothetical protein